MSDIDKLNASDLENVAAGKEENPIKVVKLPWGSYVQVYKCPSDRLADQIPGCTMHEGDHFVVTGEIVNEMVPVRVLKNNVNGYIAICFLRVADSM
jgi:hypothetical protein